MACHSGPKTIFDEAIAYVDPMNKQTWYENLSGKLYINDRLDGDTVDGRLQTYGITSNNFYDGHCTLDEVNGITWITGGHSFRLENICDGNTYYDVSRTGGAFTIWFKSSTDYTSINYTGRACILGSGSLSDFSAYCLWIQNDPPYKLLGETTLNNENWVNVDNVAEGGVWNNFTCTLSNSTATSYLNGEEIDVVSGLTGNVRIGNLSGYGYSSFGWDVPFFGSMGQHAIWDRALTEQEVKDIYNNYKSRYYK